MGDEQTKDTEKVEQVEETKTETTTEKVAEPVEGDGDE